MNFLERGMTFYEQSSGNSGSGSSGKKDEKIDWDDKATKPEIAEVAGKIKDPDARKSYLDGVNGRGKGGKKG